MAQREQRSNREKKKPKQDKNKKKDGPGGSPFAGQPGGAMQRPAQPAQNAPKK